MHVINVWRCNLVRRSAIRGRRRRRIQQSVFGGVLQSQDGRMDDVDLVAWHRSQLRGRLGYRPANMRRLADGAHRLRQLAQSCRKIWAVGVSRVKPSNCFRLHPTSNDFRSLNNFTPSIFDTSLSPFMTWNLQSYPTTVLIERKECGIFWGDGQKSKHTVTPPAYFQGGGGKTPTLRIYRCPLG